MSAIANRWLGYMRRVAAMVVGTCVLASGMAASADSGWNSRLSARDYMELGIGTAYHNMHLLYKACYDAKGRLQRQVAGHVAIEQVWDGDRPVSRTYLDENCRPVRRVDGYSRAVGEEDERGSIHIVFYDPEGYRIDYAGLNLAKDVQTTSDGWSEWMTPEIDAENRLISIGNFNLGECREGDAYTFSVTVAFRDVAPTEGKPFVFRTVGSVDGSWDYWSERNPWNSSYILLEEIPEDREYTFTKTVAISGEMSRAGMCDMSFRCDYWGCGSFRVRDVKIEKGDTATEWSPGV